MATRDYGDPYGRNGENEYFQRPGNLNEDRTNRYNEPYQTDVYENSGYQDYDYSDYGYSDYDDYDYHSGYTPENVRNGGYDDYGYDDGYYDTPYEAPRGPSMAARAAGKSNTDPYSYSRSQQRPERQVQRQMQREYSREEYIRPQRRKKRHPFRRLFVTLLVLAAIIGIGYYLLFQPPEQWNDGYHTRKSGFYNIMICATDEEELRTDTIMIASLDMDNGGVTLTSVPRDTIVDNGDAVPKLNGVYGIAGGGEAGAEAMMDELQKILGFRPDGYAIINYEIFRDVVDAMGGVTFDVPMDMEVDNPEGGMLEISAGEQLLDGDTALGVCRYRYGYLMADIQRQYVQQSFLKALIKQLASPEKLIKLPAVYSAAMDNVLTNLSGGNIRYLALQVLLGGVDDIQQNTLPGEGVDYNGASCFGLYGQSVVDMVNVSMNPFVEDITLEDVHILSVSNGMLVESTWSGTPFDASQYVYN